MGNVMWYSIYGYVGHLIYGYMKQTNMIKQHDVRKSPRATFHDYSGGHYFITVCTADKRHYFGEIKHGEMLLNTIGEFCQQQLETVSLHYPYASIPLFVVMPNHIHAIICIEATDVRQQRMHEPYIPTKRSALSVVVGGIKREVTMFARRNNLDFAWQGRYHDHIIRGSHDGNHIAEYIQNNVARWTQDCFNNNTVGTHGSCVQK